jgi:hypothetical protein
MLQKRRTRRRLLNVLAALMVISGVLWTSAAVFAQSNNTYSLGCWAITSGGGDQRTSAQFRMRDAITPVGGEIQSAQFRIRANHYALYPVLTQGGSVAPAPKAGDIFMPIIWARGLFLQNLCR